MTPKIIILTGKAQSGKDTSAIFIKKLMESKGIKSKLYPLAEPLKRICSEMFGLSEDQCWGSNAEKDTNTLIKWKNLPLCRGKLAKLMLDKYPKTIDDYMTARELMQVLGTDIFRKIDQDCWSRSILNQIIKDQIGCAIISDARFPNELDFFIKHDPIVIRLTRNVLNNSHESETALDAYDFKSIAKLHLLDNANMSMEEKNSELKKIIELHI
jgi:hypothetical protein